MMALVNRLSRLFTADFHAVLDRVEEPGALLKQSIREMEQSLADSEQRLRSLSQRHAQLVARSKQLDQLIDEIDSELDVCFEADQDELAKSQIRRKLETQRMVRIVAGRLQQTEQELSNQRSEVTTRRAQLDSVKQKAEIFSEQQTDSVCDRANDFRVSADEVEVAYLREKQQRAGA